MSAIQTRSDNRPKTALILSAGAPHSPLMAGALCALYDNYKRTGKLEEKGGKLFDVIYTSGAGALIGLLLAAPKCKDPRKALESIVELGVSDPIYSLLPINFKVFFKPGPFTRPIQRVAQLFKVGEFPFRPLPEPSSPLGEWYNHWVRAGQTLMNVGHGELRRLYNDLVDLWAATITPTTLTYWSKGVCDPLPFIEDLIDFDTLGEKGEDFFLNFTSRADIVEAAADARKKDSKAAPRGQASPSHSGTGAAMKVFQRGQITPDHVRAAFAYPFIYTPVRIDGNLSFEGANWEPISFGSFLKTAGALGIGHVVLIDIVSELEQFLLREPRNLWDAFGLSIILPVVAHAKKELARFEEGVDRDTGRHPNRRFTFRKITFVIEPDEGAHVLDWSYSNMSAMFANGRKAGEGFFRKYRDEL